MIFSISLIITGCFLFVGSACGIIRLISGPSLADRVVSLDYLTFVAIAAIALLAIKFNQSLYIDVAIVLALLGFLATIAFARYAEKRQERGDGPEDLDD